MIPWLLLSTFLHVLGRAEFNDGNAGNKCVIEILSNSEFSNYYCISVQEQEHITGILRTEYDANKRHLLGLSKLPGADKPDTLDEEQKLVQISSVIPLDSINLICSIGVLLKYVEKHRLGIELDDKTERIPILAIKNFSLWDLSQQYWKVNHHC